MSDHEAVYAIIKAGVTRYPPRHKCIRNEKQLDMQTFKQDFSSLHSNVIYGLESQDDLVDAFYSLVTECLDRHAPLKKVKVTRPPAPWMASDEIREFQATRDKARAQACFSGTYETWTAFRAVRNSGALAREARTAEHHG